MGKGTHEKGPDGAVAAIGHPCGYIDFVDIRDRRLLVGPVVVCELTKW